MENGPGVGTVVDQTSVPLGWSKVSRTEGKWVMDRNKRVRRPVRD